MVILWPRHRWSDAVLPSDRGLASVCIQGFGCRHSCERIFMLQPLHTSLSLSASASAAQQLAHYLLAKWPELAYFFLDHLELPAASVAFIAQLANADCLSSQYLNHLNLSHCGLATQDCLVLNQGNWLALRTLELTHNRIDAVVGMALLAKGKWTRLTTLQLTYNHPLDAEAMTRLSAANWSLQSLGRSHMPISAALTAELAQLHLSQATSVTLTSPHIAAAICEFASADWPCLRVLDLGQNALDAAAMQHLCRICMSKLVMLMLSNATITGEGAFWLAQGSWPCLHGLSLSHNQLDAEAVTHIASGVWPSCGLFPCKRICLLMRDCSS